MNPNSSLCSAREAATRGSPSTTREQPSLTAFEKSPTAVKTQRGLKLINSKPEYCSKEKRNRDRRKEQIYGDQVGPRERDDLGDWD